jgi:uncharacterized protein (UPF0179 family)
MEKVEKRFLAVAARDMGLLAAVTRDGRDDCAILDGGEAVEMPVDEADWEVVCGDKSAIVGSAVRVLSDERQACGARVEQVERGEREETIAVGGWKDWKKSEKGSGRVIRPMAIFEAL